MAIAFSPAVLVDGLYFPEGPRWRSTSGAGAGAAAGKLWFSDILAGKVMAVDLEGRLEPLAEPGGILVSGKFHDEVRRKLDLSFVNGGAQEMKNIEEPVSTFMVEIGSATRQIDAYTQQVLSHKKICNSRQAI